MDDQVVSGGMTPSSNTESAVSPAAIPVSSEQSVSEVPSTDDTTVQPSPSIESAIPTFGPIPRERFDKVNMRMQEAERRFKEMQETYGDVLSLPADQAKQLSGFAREFARDPVATMIQLNDQLMSHPQYGPQLASQAARVLAARRGQAPPAPSPEPEPDLVAENGQPVYSAARLREWRVWADKQTEARISQRIEPLEREARTRQQEQQVAAVRQRADQEAGTLLETAKSWYGFEAHQPAVTEAFREHPDWTLQDAYLHVLHTVILPAMPAQAQATVVAQLQQKAAAQTMNPAGGTATATPDFKGDFLAALKYADTHRK